ncbi:MAG: PEGA domain-containing protein, partial [Polyangia bacterium]
AASRAYPTLNRRWGTGVVVTLIVVLGAAGAVIWKLRPGSAVPAHPVTTSAATIAPEAPPAAAPSPPPAPAPEPAAPAPAAPPVAAAPPVEKPAAEKPAPEERAPSRRSSRHRAHEEASSGRAPSEAAAAPAEAKSAEAKPVEEKPPADKPAAPETAPAAETKAATAVLKITSSPAGADVSIDGSPVGMTPFTSRDIDPGSPHAITLKKDGFETHERMVGASDWSRAHGSTPPSLKVNVKLRRIAPPPGAETPKETGAPAEDTGGPYIKEVNPSSP